MSRRVADANPNVVLHVRWFRGHHQRAESTKFQPPSSGTIFGLGMGDHDESRKHMVRVNLTVVRNSLPEATGSEKSPMACPRASRGAAYGGWCFARLTLTMHSPGPWSHRSGSTQRPSQPRFRGSCGWSTAIPNVVPQSRSRWDTSAPTPRDAVLKPCFDDDPS